MEGRADKPVDASGTLLNLLLRQPALSSAFPNDRAKRLFTIEVCRLEVLRVES